MSQFRSFITEEEVAEIKQKRQDEWERVRKPDDPLGAPLAPNPPPSQR